MNKKNFISACILISFLFGGLGTGIAQENKKSGKIGLYFASFGVNEIFTFESLDGSGSYKNDNFFTLGVNYLHSLNKRIAIETGVEYSKHNVKIQPAFTGEGVDYSDRKESFKLISVPVVANVYFGKYIFANGGIILDFDISGSNSIDKQTGMGTILGIGAKYDFESGVSAYLNPYFKLHTLVPFSSERYHQRVWESGIKLGITCSL
ncbi:outer membrane beta-barrel protein [Dysgonomonas gadei]|uniref:Outer membrane protein beta-barrel domain-containing protein n=1 Tax=Dysgonomonas gadei ATCC BAA-286 TaxID=742766 RepID=F5IVL6_9BACT|nr:outer membrane beta-barrel protein [Dysgonomonas gadei]EGK02666.1 hypothetical protein HMPREF9455_00916 [Dysgonomonas gadei ATCC BAA-286]